MDRKREAQRHLFWGYALVACIFGSLVGGLAIYKYEKDQETHGNLLQMQDSPTLLEFSAEELHQIKFSVILGFNEECECSCFFENQFFALTHPKENYSSINLLRIYLGENLNSISGIDTIPLIDNISGWHLRGLASNGTHIWFLSVSSNQDSSDLRILSSTIVGELEVNRTVPLPTDFDFNSNYGIQRDWLGFNDGKIWIKEWIVVKTPISENSYQWDVVYRRFRIFDPSNGSLEETVEVVFPESTSRPDLLNFEGDNIWWRSYSDPYNTFEGNRKWTTETVLYNLIQLPIEAKADSLPARFVRTARDYLKNEDLDRKDQRPGMSRILGNRSIRFLARDWNEVVEGIILDVWEPIPYPVEEVFTMGVGIGIFAFAWVVIIRGRKQDSQTNSPGDSARKSSPLEKQPSSDN